MAVRLGGLTKPSCGIGIAVSVVLPTVGMTVYLASAVASGFPSRAFRPRR
jgi:hypothetical protein